MASGLGAAMKRAGLAAGGLVLYAADAWLIFSRAHSYESSGGNAKALVLLWVVMFVAGSWMLMASFSRQR